MSYETPSWEKPTDIFWCVTVDGELFGYGTYAGAKSLADCLGGGGMSKSLGQTGKWSCLINNRRVHE